MDQVPSARRLALSILRAVWSRRSSATAVLLIMLPIWSLYAKKRSAIFRIRGSLEVRPRSERTRALQVVATYSGTRRKFIHSRTFVGSWGSQNPFGFWSLSMSRAQPILGILE